MKKRALSRQIVRQKPVQGHGAEFGGSGDADRKEHRVPVHVEHVFAIRDHVNGEKIEARILSKTRPRRQADFPPVLGKHFGDR